MSKQYLIIGNWKEYVKSSEEAKSILDSLNTFVYDRSRVALGVCPSKEYFNLYQKGNFELGSQDITVENLKEIKTFGVTFSIIGHADRRREGESGEMINKKIKSLIENMMGVCLCIGEEKEMSEMEWQEVLVKQIDEAFFGLASVGYSIIAYEPVFKIGASEAMIGSEIRKRIDFIKDYLENTKNSFKKEKIVVLYGGAVDKSTGSAIIRESRADGLLVGRESVKLVNFKELIKNVEQI